MSRESTTKNTIQERLTPMRFMFLSVVRPMWLERINELGISQREFCSIAGVKYDTWKHLKNPTYNLLHHIESELTKLEELEASE